MATPLLRAELLLFAGTVATGAGLAIAYYMLCAFRFVLPCGPRWVVATDILFFVAAAFVTYTTIYRLGNGVVRYYASVGLVLGAALVRAVVKCVQNRLQKRRIQRTINRAEDIH